jgi:hypothetical protein
VQGNFYLSGESMLDYHLPTCALNTGKDEFCTCSGIKGGAYRTPETLENIPRLPEFIKTIEHIRELHVAIPSVTLTLVIMLICLLLDADATELTFRLLIISLLSWLVYLSCLAMGLLQRMNP